MSTNKSIFIKCVIKLEESMILTIYTNSKQNFLSIFNKYIDLTYNILLQMYYSYLPRHTLEDTPEYYYRLFII